MTILEVVQEASGLLGLTRPTSVVNSTDEDAQRLLYLAKEALREVSDIHQFAELTKTASFTLVDSQQAYAFPDDYHSQLPNTHWNTTGSWPMNGPVSNINWQVMQNGVVATVPHPYFKIEGYADNQILIFPTPDSGDAGTVLQYKYISSNIIRPRTWAAGQTYAAGSYTFYNGNYYSTTSGGTSGATAPTHTSGSGSDDNITWDYYSTAYRKFLADTDVPLLDSDCLIKDIRWRFLRSIRFEFEDLRQESDEAWKRCVVNKKGSKIINFGKRSGYPFLSNRNLPDTGYGS